MRSEDECACCPWRNDDKHCCDRLSREKAKMYTDDGCIYYCGKCGRQVWRSCLYCHHCGVEFDR